MDLKDTLLAFGEWLDGEDVIDHAKDGDDRTYEDLAKEFIEQWEARPGTATLAGRGERVDKVNRHSADALGLAPVPDQECEALDGRSCVTLGCPIHE